MISFLEFYFMRFNCLINQFGCLLMDLKVVTCNLLCCLVIMVYLMSFSCVTVHVLGSGKKGKGCLIFALTMTFSSSAMSFHLKTQYMTFSLLVLNSNHGISQEFPGKKCWPLTKKYWYVCWLSWFLEHPLTSFPPPQHMPWLNIKGQLNICFIFIFVLYCVEIMVF